MTPLTTQLIGLILKSTIILSFSYAATLVLCRQSAALRHMVWTVGLISAIALPFFSAVVPAWHLVPAREVQTSIQVAARASGAPAEKPVAVSSEPTVPPVSSSMTPQRLGFFVWLAGALCIASLLLRETIRLARVAIGASDVEQSSWRDLARDLSRALQLTRRVRLMRNPKASVLGTWGALRPRVLLPRESEAWSDERIRVVLGHELAHVKRNDWLVQLVAEIARAVYWFNPLFWIACNQLRRESEHACDDAALFIGSSSGVDGPTYAAHVLELARSLKHSGQPGSVALAMASSSNLERRLVAMLNPSLDRRFTSKRTAGIVILLALGLTLPLAAMQSTAPAPAVTVARPVERAPQIPVAPSTTTAPRPVVVRPTTPQIERVVSISPPVRVETFIAGAPQSATGTFSGTVTDPSGALIPGVRVNMTAQSTGRVQQGLTNESGVFSFMGLAPDNYSVTAELPGFQQGKFLYVLSDPGSSARVRFTLQVAPYNVVVEITTQAPPGVRCIDMIGTLKADGTRFTQADCPGAIVAGVAARPVVRFPVESSTSTATMVGDTVQQPTLQPNGRPYPIRVGGDLQSARLLSHPNPAYPAEARSKGVEGVVVVAGIIARDGTLRGLNIIGSSNPLLEVSVIETIQTWTFKPALLNREPTESMVTVTVNFTLGL